ncbi:unnamed protein product [Linum tenue]|uniref:Uncharacterized protein n=1 Tax=Linum tenue TaxID=586396 RepID=A0AAV0QFM7_9ROSI|nr:unnamed protein product [Linum tenue]
MAGDNEINLNESKRVVFLEHLGTNLQLQASLQPPPPPRRWLIQPRVLRDRKGRKWRGNWRRRTPIPKSDITPVPRPDFHLRKEL